MNQEELSIAMNTLQKLTSRALDALRRQDIPELKYSINLMQSWSKCKLPKVSKDDGVQYTANFTPTRPTSNETASSVEECTPDNETQNTSD